MTRSKRWSEVIVESLADQLSEGRSWSEEQYDEFHEYMNGDELPKPPIGPYSHNPTAMIDWIIDCAIKHVEGT